MLTTSSTTQTSCDAAEGLLQRKFVRVIEKRDDGLVSFDFSIGWPELSVELLMPTEAFDDFCATHRVRQLDVRVVTTLD